MKHRSRIIKGEFFQNRKLAGLSTCHRLLFIGLWTIADREGRLLDDLDLIKAMVFPFENVDIDKLLNDLAGFGFIERYNGSKEACIFIPKFLEHQKIHTHEAQSKLPEPPNVVKCSVMSPTDLEISIGRSNSNSRSRGRSKEKNPDFKSAVDYFCVSFEKKFEIKYDFKGDRDGATIKRLLGSYGLPTLKQIIDQLFVTDDDFVAKQAGRTIGVLSACSNKLAQEVAKKRKMQVYDLQERLGRVPTKEEISKLFGGSPTNT